MASLSCSKSSVKLSTGCFAPSTNKLSAGLRPIQSRKPTVVVTAFNVEVDETKGAKSRLTLKVKVPKDSCLETYNEVVRELGKEVRIPGFRPGQKVSPKLLVGHFGVKNVKGAVLDALLNRAVPEALDTVASRALDESEKIETQMEEMLDNFGGPSGEPQDDLTFDIGVDVAPEIKWKSSYKDISVTVQAKGDDSSIAVMAENDFRVRWKDLGTLRVVPATDRGLKADDIAVIDLAAALVKEDGSVGEEIPGVNNKNFRFDTSEGDGFLPGLVEAVVGMKTGDTREFELDFPQDWYIEKMQGVTGRFTAVMKELFWRELPKLSDELAPKLKEGCTTIQQVKDEILKESKETTEGATENSINEALTDAVADIVDADLPDSLVQEQGRQNYSVRMLELLSAGQITKDVLNTMMSEEMVANYMEHKRDEVERMVRLTLGVGEIQKLEKLEVPVEKVDEEARNSEKEFERLGQEYDQERVREQAKELLEGALVLDWLKATCDVTVEPFENPDCPSGQESGDGTVVYKFDD